MKTVILFYSKDSSWTIIGINYSDEDAKAEVDRLRKDKLPTYEFNQRKRYNNESEAEKSIMIFMKKITKSIQKNKELLKR